MLADELDFMIGVDPHRDRNAVAFVRSPTGQVMFEAIDGRLERRLSGGLAAGRAARAGSARVRDRRNGLLRRALPASWSSRASELSRSAGSNATAHRGEDRPARRGPRRPQRARQDEAGPAALGRQTRGAARVDGRARGSAERETRRALPAARPAGHLPRAAPRRVNSSRLIRSKRQLNQVQEEKEKMSSPESTSSMYERPSAMARNLRSSTSTPTTSSPASAKATASGSPT